MYIFYPSCNFKRFFPETAERIKDYLATQPDVIYADCCHKTNSIPKPGDIIVTVCMSCYRGLAEIRPDIEQIGFAEFMLTRKDFVWPDHSGEELTIQDCFRARGLHSLQDSARTCLAKMNYSVVEMENNRDEELFDGNFLLHDPYPINVKEAPEYYGKYLPRFVNVRPESEWHDVMTEHVRRYRTGTVACYCNTCTMGARDGGADAYHLAQLIFQ